MYRTNTNVRGLGLVIANYNYSLSPLQGPEVDGKEMASLLSKIGYNISICYNLQNLELLKIAEKFSKQEFHDNADSCVIYYSGHGGPGTITGIDGVNVTIDQFLQFLSPTKCPFLVGKPKTFIFDCCRGTQNMCKDGGASPTLNFGDTCFVYSSEYGFYSFDTRSGGLFTKIFIQVCNEEKPHSIMDAFEKTNKILTATGKQRAEIKFTTTAKMQLYPKKLFGINILRPVCENESVRFYQKKILHTWEGRIVNNIVDFSIPLSDPIFASKSFRSKIIFIHRSGFVTLGIKQQGENGFSSSLTFVNPLVIGDVIGFTYSPLEKKISFFKNDITLSTHPVAPDQTSLYPYLCLNAVNIEISTPLMDLDFLFQNLKL